jgi:chromosomal replication initiator protein
MDIATDELWKKVLADIKKEVSEGTFLTLFRNTTLISLIDETATIAAPSLMVIDLLKKRFAEKIQQSLKNHTSRQITLTFTTKTPVQATKADTKPLFTPEVKTSTQQSVGHLPRVRPEYTFANFAVSSSNQLAFVSANTVSEHIGTSYNPFFIYGPVGVGKTHLMHAIANEAYQKDPQKKIIYITSEEFTNDVVEAIRNNETARMKKKFRSAYLLLIDDIQFIEGKERVQEELFHTFNILIDQGSQICLSSDRPPQEIRRIEKRLSSRFSGGLTVDIEPPDFELKTAILLIKSQKYGHELPIEVAKYIADRSEDTRSLEGLLLRVITQATTLSEPVTLDLAMRSFGGMLEEKKAHVHAEDVIKNVCSYYRIKPTQLRGPKRDAALVRARQVTMYLLKSELRLTYVEIGNILGGRDHTTIMHGVDKVSSMISQKTPVASDIVGITKTLRE